MAKTDRQKQNKNNLNRRDFVKGLATVPVLGGFLAATLVKQSHDKGEQERLLKELDIEVSPPVVDDLQNSSKQDLIRLGIIGVGSRGTSILEDLGFTVPGLFYNEYYPNLNVVIHAVCDVYDDHASQGIAMSQKNRFAGEDKKFPFPKKYRNYQELLNDKNIDAVIIATPDHWHARMTIDAAEAGKHIYCEKCLTLSIEDAVKVRSAIKNHPVVFQYGHQNRQQDSFRIARQIIKKQVLGHVTLIKTHTYRNTPEGAWIFQPENPIDPGKLDWTQWQGPAPKMTFSPDRFTGWVKFMEYSGGLPPHLFSHEYDAINQLMDLGIPSNVIASGGTYYWKDGRNTPDVLQACFEYPERDLMLTYDANLASSSTGEYEYGAKVKEFYGSDAWMKLAMDINVIPDRRSIRYREQLDKKLMNPATPFLSYKPGQGIDAVTSASDKYYAARGLMYTYRGEEKINVSYLHFREWLNCIRNGGQTSCHIDLAFQDAVTCLMATKSYLEGKMVTWDPDNQKVVS